MVASTRLLRVSRRALLRSRAPRIEDGGVHRLGRVRAEFPGDARGGQLRPGEDRDASRCRFDTISGCNVSTCGMPTPPSPHGDGAAPRCQQVCAGRRPECECCEGGGAMYLISCCAWQRRSSTTPWVGSQRFPFGRRPRGLATAGRSCGACSSLQHEAKGPQPAVLIRLPLR